MTILQSIVDRLVSVRRSFNRTLFASVALICLSQFNFGFDQSAYATTQAMDAFERQFGTCHNGKCKIETYFLSLLNSLPYIGFVAGLLIGSEISARWGRRMVMFVMSLYALCTAAITFSSRTRGQMLTGRILNYAFVGMELAVVPVFQSEIVPKRVRGMIVGTYQLMLFLGSLIMSVICYGTAKLPDNRQWQIPFGLFFIIPTLVASAIWFIPESPRWLMLKGHEEKALESLRKIRRGCFTEDEILLELKEIKAVLSEEKEQGTFFDLFRGSNMKRTIITCGTNFFLQLTGNVFANKYGTVYIKSLGTIDPFLMTIINQLVQLLGVVFAMNLVDRWGRRPLLLFGGAVQAVSLLTMAGLGSKSHSDTYKTGIIAMLTIFGFGFASGWAPVSHIITAEVPSSRLRDMTYRTASTINILIQFVTSFATPYLLGKPGANLGAGVGYLYGGAAVFAIVFAYFMIPECMNRTLEEIDQLFLDGVSIRGFKSASVTIHSYSEDGKEDGRENDLALKDSTQPRVTSHETKAV